MRYNLRTLLIALTLIAIATGGLRWWLADRRVFRSVAELEARLLSSRTMAPGCQSCSFEIVDRPAKDRLWCEVSQMTSPENTALSGSIGRGPRRHNVNLPQPSKTGYWVVVIVEDQRGNREHFSILVACPTR